MKYVFFPVIAAVALYGCASSYQAPAVAQPKAVFQVEKSRAELMQLVKRSLVSAGYQITSADDSSGIIQTALKDRRLTPEDADCGKVMGLDYLKDKRTTTRVGFGVIVDDGRLEVRANIQGEYKVGSTTNDITLACISRGGLEKEVFDLISK